LTLTWLCTNASQTFSGSFGTFSGTSLNLTRGLHQCTPELFWAEGPISLRCWGTIKQIDRQTQYTEQHNTKQNKTNQTNKQTKPNQNNKKTKQPTNQPNKQTNKINKQTDKRKCEQTSNQLIVIHFKGRPGICSLKTHFEDSVAKPFGTLRSWFLWYTFVKHDTLLRPSRGPRIVNLQWLCNPRQN
jgi:hypothetical protein